MENEHLRCYDSTMNPSSSVFRSKTTILLTAALTLLTFGVQFLFGFACEFGGGIVCVPVAVSGFMFTPAVMFVTGPAILLVTVIFCVIVYYLLVCCVSSIFSHEAGHLRRAALLLFALVVFYLAVWYIGARVQYDREFRQVVPPIGGPAQSSVQASANAGE